MKILEEILNQLKAQSMSNRLWDTNDIGIYIGLSQSSVSTRIVCQSDFPEAIRIPTEEGRTGRRWYPEEVKLWVAKHRAGRDKSKRGRPRAQSV